MQDVAGMKIFKLPWTDALNSLSFVTLEERKYPLEFWSYIYIDSAVEELGIVLPPNRQFVEIPRNVKLECSVASYELTFDIKPGKEIKAKRVFIKKKDIVSPEEYKDFRDFINAVGENDAKQYAIK